MFTRDLSAVPCIQPVSSASPLFLSKSLQDFLGCNRQVLQTEADSIVDGVGNHNTASVQGAFGAAFRADGAVRSLDSTRMEVKFGSPSAFGTV